MSQDLKALMEEIEDLADTSFQAVDKYRLPGESPSDTIKRLQEARNLERCHRASGRVRQVRFEPR
ncbi:MAG TPA: hypothetical protein PLY13_02980 [Methanoregulaceae archaeon]|nr:hypothetical protein [Methanoregulaceae archaeon]